jgi:hypothetical protein
VETAIPDWFQDLIITGIQRLLCLSLDGRPAEAMVTATAAAWIDAAWRARAWTSDDASQIDEAFRDLASAARRWPAPPHLLDFLPGPRALAAPYHAPAKTRTRALTSDASRERIRALLDATAAKLEMRHGP